MKIKTIHQGNLRNEEVFQFMGSTITLIEAANEAVKTAAEPVIDSFKNAYSRFDAVLEQIRKSALTDTIAEQDTVRDNLYRAICLVTEGFAHSNIPGQIAAAAAVQAIIDHYGDFRMKPYNEETAIIHNFIQDLRDRCAPQLLTLGIDGWVSDLDMANNNFEKLMADRFSDAAAHVNSDKAKALRNEIGVIYNQIVTTINALIVVNGQTDYAGFVNKLNEQIQYYNTTLAERQGRSKARKEKNTDGQD